MSHVVTDDDTKAKKAAKALGDAGTVVAIALIVLWIVGLFFLWSHIDNEEARWTRILVIFHSIEAVGFAAVGAILGVQVQRVKTAEKGEKEAKAETANEKKISQLGVSLADSVLAEKGRVPLETATDDHSMPVSVKLAQQLLARRARL